MIEREVFAKNQMIKHLKKIEDAKFLNDIDIITVGLNNGRTSKQEAHYIGESVKEFIKDLQDLDKFLGEVKSL